MSVSSNPNDIAVQAVLRLAIALDEGGNAVTPLQLSAVNTGRHIIVGYAHPSEKARMVPLLALSLEEAEAFGQDIVRAARTGSEPSPETLAAADPEVRAAVVEVMERAKARVN